MFRILKTIIKIYISSFLYVANSRNALIQEQANRTGKGKVEKQADKSTTNKPTDR